ncbi:MAG: CARDB domain-containing protein [Thermodesulfovibrionales bacterium]
MFVIMVKLTNKLNVLTLFQILTAILLFFAPHISAADPLDNWHIRSSGGAKTVAYGNNTFVAVISTTNMLTSPDGLVWTPSTTAFDWESLEGITYCNSIFVTVGRYSIILISEDGQTWVDTTPSTYFVVLGDVTYGNGQFVVVGGYFDHAEHHAAILTSTNGFSWTKVLWPYMAEKHTRLTGITFGDNKFIAVSIYGDGGILASSNGINWTISNVGLTGLLSIAYGNSKFVAVGTNGTILTSPDGNVWTPRTSGVLYSLYKIVYSNNNFIAVGDSGTILTSPDGINWNIRNSGIQNNLRSITYGNNTFVAVGPDIILQSDPIISQFTLTISTIGNGDCTVTSNPSGIICGPDCSENYNEGTVVTLTAEPDGNSVFAGWSGGACTGTGTCVTTLNSDKTVIANFGQILNTLSLSKSGNGSVKVNSNLLSLPWSGQFPSGTNVQIEAVPDSGWSFTNWSGDYTGSTNPTTLNINGNKNITANFSQNCDYSLTININPTGSGTVTKNPDKNNYCNNEQVTLTANPNSGYTFSFWNGVDSSSGTTASINMNANRSVSANFNQQTLNGPDFTGSWTSLVQSCKGIKCKINGKCNIQNIGSESASSSVRFYLSDDGVYHEGDSFLKEAKTGTLKVGKSKSISLSYSLPSGISATDKYIIALIDADNTVMEANESNNIIIYGPILRANLTGMWTSLTQQCKGEKCKIKGALNIQNIGYQDAASFVNFYLSDDGAYDAGDMFLKKVSIGTLKVSKSKKMNLSYSFPSGVSAYGKYIIAVIDADNSVLEENEGDNNIIYGPLP